MIQLQFLNYLLKSKDSSVLINNSITGEFFSDYPEQYQFIKQHYDTYGNLPDIHTFMSKFPDFDVIDVKENSQYLIDELYDDRNKRMLASIFNRIRELLTSGKTDEAMSVYNSMSQQLLTATHANYTDIIHDTSRYDAYIEKCRDFNKYYLSTGFKELDDAIGGWDRLEELATIIARPGVGKSWVVLKCAIAAAEQGLKVGLYSGEMTALKVGYRFDTLFGHISNSGLMRGRTEIQNDYKNYLDTLSDKIKGSIKVLNPSDLGGGGHAATVTDLRAFIEKEELDVLCIDQHSLLEDERNARDPVVRAANISRDLKNLQTIKKIPIIAVSQMNRSGRQNDEGEEEIDLTRIAQTDRIGQDSTAVISLDKKDDVLTMNILKSRDAISGKKLKYAIDLDKGIFNYLAYDNDANNGQECEEIKSEFDGTKVLKEESPF